MDAGISHDARQSLIVSLTKCTCRSKRIGTGMFSQAACQSSFFFAVATRAQVTSDATCLSDFDFQDPIALDNWSRRAYIVGSLQRDREETRK